MTRFSLVMPGGDSVGSAWNDRYMMVGASDPHGSKKDTVHKDINRFRCMAVLFSHQFAWDEETASRPIYCHRRSDWVALLFV